MKDRDLSLDIIRIVACFLVVLMHSPLPSANIHCSGIIQYSSPYYITRIG